MSEEMRINKSPASGAISKCAVASRSRRNSFVLPTTFVVANVNLKGARGLLI